MPKLESFSIHWLQIVEHVCSHQTPLVVPTPDERMARAMQSRWYKFRKAALSEGPPDLKSQVESVAVSRQGATLTFSNREDTPEAQILASALLQAKEAAQ